MRLPEGAVTGPARVNESRRKLRRGSLFLVLIVPLLSLMATVASLIIYVSYANGRSGADELAHRLMEEVGQRIDQNLSGYLNDLEEITRTNAALLGLGVLDPRNRPVLLRHFAEQLKTYRHASTVMITTEQYEGLALERDDVSLILREYDREALSLRSYRLNDGLERTEFLGAIEGFDPSHDPPQDPWYQKVKAKNAHSWHLAATLGRGFDNPELMLAEFSPVHEKGAEAVTGVASASAYLSHFGRFLVSLRIGATGQAFVVERTGGLISTSTGELPFQRVTDKTYAAIMAATNLRIAAVSSGCPVTSSTMKAVLARYGDLHRIQGPALMEHAVGGKRYLVRIVPIQRAELDWLTILVVPEMDFMDDVDRSLRNGAILCVAALILAMLLGILLVRWVTTPIRHLTTAAGRIAAGDWGKVVPATRSDEIGELARAFNSMSVRLKDSFEVLDTEIAERRRAEKEIARLNVTLEQRVADRTAELEFINRELESFTSSVSHDLRAPLRAIEGYSRFLLEDYGEKLDAEGLRLVRVIRQGTRTMEEIISGLLTLSRVTKVELRRDRVDMEGLLGGVLDQVPEETRRSLDVRLHPLVEAWGDTTMLRQVWANLLSNAIKYTTRSPLRRIEIGSRLDHDQVVYFVRDSGVGFDEAYAHKLFNVFQRLHHAEEFEGHGVGLAIVRRIIDRHRGRVWAEGRVGHGATFYFALPVAMVAEPRDS